MYIWPNVRNIPVLYVTFFIKANKEVLSNPLHTKEHDHFGIAIMEAHQHLLWHWTLLNGIDGHWQHLHYFYYIYNQITNDSIAFASNNSNKSFLWKL
jgi:hypothetical protein